MNQSAKMTFTINRNWLTAFLLFILLLVIYSNSFHCSWHFDDKPNIINRQNIHLSDLTSNSITKTFFKQKDSTDEHSQKLYRPFSCLTLGINWYFGKTDVFGYHVVNFGIHVVTAIVLFLTVLKLFQTPKLKGYGQKQAYFIALLSATLWAIHPIQVQAVTFIVQRMASLAAMFTLLGIFFYLKARLGQRTRDKLYYLSSFIAFILAIASKENAALFPIAILLIELSFFEYLRIRFSKKILALCLALFIFSVGLLGVILFKEGDFLFFLNGYENRGFTFAERILTEPRIIVFYLSQIFYPLTTRFSITHDIELSTSLINPWTTIPAIIIIFGLIAFGFSQIYKRPWLGFPILFYFLYHLIESTVIPLELVFEHRNYLPSIFLFLPISIGCYKLLTYYEYNKKMYYILSAFLAFLIMIVGLGTYSRNMDWRTNETLWKDAVKKAPTMARPLHNLANFYHRHGKYDRSLELNKKALGLYDPKPKFAQYLTYYNISNNYLQKDDYQKAIAFLKKAIQSKSTAKARYNLCVALMGSGQINNAEKELKQLISQRQLPKYINLLSLLALKGNKLNVVEKNCQQILAKDQDNQKALYYLGLLNMQKKEYLKARYFLNTVQGLNPKDIVVHFSRIENSVRAVDKIETKPLVKELFSQYKLPHIRKILDKVCNDNLSPPIDKNLILSALEKEIYQYITLDEVKKS